MKRTEIKRKSPMRRRPSTTASKPKGRGKGHEWTAIKQQVHDRDGWCCARCGIPVIKAEPSVLRAAHAHHRRLKSHGGPDLVANLITLCTVCHDWAHGHPALARLAGLIVDSAEGFEIMPVRFGDGSLRFLLPDGSYEFVEAEAC